jgi:23S rRNA-/tRNA-specific pseudouridylate synthase
MYLRSLDFTQHMVDHRSLYTRSCYIPHNTAPLRLDEKASILQFSIRYDTVPDIANPLEIIYEGFWQNTKEAGLLVHRSWLDSARLSFVSAAHTRDAVGCHVFPVHRLDKPTGVLLFAKSFLSSCAAPYPCSLRTQHYQAVFSRGARFYAREWHC